MRESAVERRVCKLAEQSGWLTFKFVSPGRRGVADRLFLRNGDAVFVEFKAPGKAATRQQLAEHARVEAQGFPVFVIDSVEAGQDMLEELG